MSTDQVVSRYPQEWEDAVSDVTTELGLYHPFVSAGDVAVRILTALEEVGALAPTEIEYNAVGPEADAVAMYRRVGPWVEVPDA